jgi:hypothetical protein
MSTTQNMLGRYLNQQADSVGSPHSRQSSPRSAATESRTSSEGGSSFKQWLNGQPQLQSAQTRTSPPSSTGPGTTTLATTTAPPPARRMAPPRRVAIRPPPRLEPLPHGSHAAVYLTITDFEDDGLIYFASNRAMIRDCSIVIQPDPSTEKFSTYHLHWQPHPVNRMKLFHINDLPDPRKGEPGLLAMNFLAWIPRQKLAFLDAEIKNIDIRRLSMVKTSLWIRLLVQKMLHAKLITPIEMEVAVAQQSRDLLIDSRVNYPNYQE